MRKYVPCLSQDRVVSCDNKGTYRARHSIERASCTIREFISSLSRSLVSRMRALVVSRATTTGVAPQGEHTRLYGFMYQKWWVHLFVISSCFCFYRDFIYDRIAEPQICDEIGWRVLFAGPAHVCTFAPTFIRPSIRLSIRLPDPFVHSFIRSFSSIISPRFYIHYNLRR